MPLFNPCSPCCHNVLVVNYQFSSNELEYLFIEENINRYYLGQSEQIDVNFLNKFNRIIYISTPTPLQNPYFESFFDTYLSVGLNGSREWWISGKNKRFIYLAHVDTSNSLIFSPYEVNNRLSRMGSIISISTDGNAHNWAGIFSDYPNEFAICSPDSITNDLCYGLNNLKLPPYPTNSYGCWSYHINSPLTLFTLTGKRIIFPPGSSYDGIYPFVGHVVGGQIVRPDGRGQIILLNNNIIQYIPYYQDNKKFMLNLIRKNA